MRQLVLLAVMAAALSAPAQEADREPKSATAELRYVERQLEELYGPLLFLVEESKLAIEEVLDSLGREALFPLSEVNKEEELKFWLFRAENDLMPRNERMCEVVRQKGHLAEGRELPATFAALLEHQAGWSLNHLRWKKEGVPYEWHSPTPFPRALGPDLRAAFKRLKDRHAELLKEVPGSELRHAERQLDELYGPLVALNREGRATYDGLLKMLGRKFVFPLDEKKKEEELRKWIFWAENGFLPRNEKTRRLLESKVHLLDEKELPATHLAFLDHANSWRINHLRWQREGVTYSWHSRTGWPAAFSLEAEAAFKRLKDRHAELLRK